MAYNKAKAEKEWLRWKEAEEKKLRELGVDEETIQRLHTYDWAQFNKERQYLQRQVEWSPYVDWVSAQDLELPVEDTKSLLDSIEDMELFSLLHTVDKLILEILFMKMDGYSSKEIASAFGMDEYAVNMRIYRLRKKIKKYLLNQKDEVIDKIADNLDIETIINDFSVVDVLNFIDDYCSYLASTEVEKPNINNLKITTIRKIEINKLNNIKEHILSLIVASDKIDQYVSYILREGMELDKYNKLKNYIINEYKALECKFLGEELYGKLLDKLIYNSMITSQVKILEAFVVNIFIRCDIFKKE